MLAKDLISDFILPLKTSDTGLMALYSMEELKVLHLPIVNNTEFLGLISESDILNLNTPEEALGNHVLSLKKPYVTASQHIYDVLKIISTLDLSLVPVLDEKLNYLGVITLSNLVKQYSKISAFENPGGIIVIELNVNDYSISEIARIVESDDAKVLSLYVSSHPDSTKLEITIKVNKIDLTSILQTFYRFNYNIKASFSEKDDQDVIQERFDSLMNYLNI
jgi:acetoin utilization protein AcuB